LDPIKNDQLQKAHDLAAAQTGEEFTDSYFNRMDHLLGFRQETKPNGSSNGHAAPTLPSVPSRPAAPIRQQQHAAPVSAPPTRQAPSMATGRVPQSMQVTLTADEKEVAWITRPREDMTPREAYEVYARNKMKALKDGAIGPGARDGR
jgi:hypothetical protein